MSVLSNPRVSVIMRCKNSDWVIDSALAALFSQTYRDFQLLVVDSGSTDRTLQRVGVSRSSCSELSQRWQL